MNRNALVFFTLVASGLRVIAAAEGSLMTESSMALDFVLKAGDRTTLERSDIDGRIVACFYETNTTSDTNDELKKELAEALEQVKADGGTPEASLPCILAVADCSSARRPFIAFWEKALRDKSKTIGYTLWGDWSGKMREDYRFAKDEANFALIDRDGRIRCRTCGKVDSRKIAEITALLMRLVEESK